MRGFTLIELLVVIAIIGVLSSVALASLSTARLRAADATVKTEAQELRTLMNEEYAETGSYTALKHGSYGGSGTSGGTWFATGDACASGNFGGTYAAQAASVCTALVKASATSACSSACVFFYSTNPDTSGSFSILAYLPGESAQAGSARYVCYGSSGRSSITVGAGNGWTDPGCWANP